MQSDKSGIGYNLMGDTSLVQLRDAIDILIGKLDEKIDASQHNASHVQSGVMSKQLGKRSKERAASNDFCSQKQKSVPKEWLL